MVNESNENYWKTKYEEIEKELEEYRVSSQMLERELESALEQSDKTIKELRKRNNNLQLDNDLLKEKYSELQEGTEARVSELEEERVQCHKREEDYVKYIRELEQKNDDLERSHRAMYVSLGEFDVKLNSALERNVLLESELDEKEDLIAMIQRLKDETRDLKQEISIRDKNKDVNTKNGTPYEPKRSTENNQSPGGKTNLTITPPGRISAMNIVGDLLRKVGTLESKLASCRSQSPSENHFRSKKLNRGTSTPSIHNLIKS